MRTHEEILGSDFEKLNSEFQLYNMTTLSIKTGELKFSKWLEMFHYNDFLKIKKATIKDIEAQRIEMGCE
jgi:hypothetical protein